MYEILEIISNNLTIGENLMAGSNDRKQPMRRGFSSSPTLSDRPLLLNLDPETELLLPSPYNIRHKDSRKHRFSSENKNINLIKGYERTGDQFVNLDHQNANVTYKCSRENCRVNAIDANSNISQINHSANTIPICKCGTHMTVTTTDTQDSNTLHHKTPEGETWSCGNSMYSDPLNSMNSVTMNSPNSYNLNDELEMMETLTNEETILLKNTNKKK